MIVGNLTKHKVLELVKSGKRIDGRKHIERRDISIEIGVIDKAEGSARVKLGNTDLIVGVKLGVGTPYPDSKDQGNLRTTVELTCLSNPEYELGPPSIEAIELARVTDRVVRESKAIDLKKLCIISGEKVWTVFIDIYTIDADGNLFDAAAMGAVAALKSARLTKLDSENNPIYGEFEGKFPIAKFPKQTTIVKIGDSLLLDPTEIEEKCATSRITIGTCEGAMVSLQLGGAGLTPEDVMKALDIAFEKENEISYD